MVFNHMMVLMQAEVERFHAGASLVHDYFQSKTQEILRDDSVVLVSERSSAVVFRAGDEPYNVFFYRC